MSDNVKEVKFGKQPPAGLATTFRALADKIDRGDVVSAVAAYIDGDEYCFVLGASLTDELVMSTLLQTRVVDKFRK